MAYITVFDEKELKKYSSEYDKTKSGKDWLDNAIQEKQKDYPDKRTRNDEKYTPFGFGFVLTAVFNITSLRFIIMFFFFPFLPLIFLLEDVYKQNQVCNNEYWIYKWWIYSSMIIVTIFVTPMMWYVASIFFNYMIIIMFPATGILWVGMYLIFNYIDNKYSKDYNYYYLIDNKLDLISKRKLKIIIIPFLIFVVSIFLDEFLQTMFSIINALNLDLSLKNTEYIFYDFRDDNSYYAILSMIIAIGYDIYEQKKLKRDVSIGFWDKRVKYYIFFGFFVMVAFMIWFEILDIL